MRNLETNMHNVDFVWTSDKEYSSLLPIYKYMKKNVPSINTNVKVSLEGSVDGTNYAEIVSEKTLTSNGTYVYNVANTPVRWIRPRFISETGGTAATVVFSVAAA